MAAPGRGRSFLNMMAKGSGERQRSDGRRTN
jgi:hypothetical protein